MLNKLVVNAEIQHRALKLRIYPTEQQEILINKTFGCCRQIYNNRLFERNQFYDTVIRPVEDKAKQKELWKTAHFSTEKETELSQEVLLWTFINKTVFSSFLKILFPVFMYLI